MKIIDPCPQPPLGGQARCVEYQRSGPSRQQEVLAVEERLLEVSLNGILAMKLVCSPGYLPELILGRLYTEGAISGAGDVESIRISPQGSRAEVRLYLPVPPTESTFVDTTVSCFAGSRDLNPLLQPKRPLSPVIPIPWRREWIFSLAEEFVRSTPAYAATRGTHSCFLAASGRTLYCTEDLGRHNALDKVVGCALRDGFDLTQAILYSSGRVPMDMAVKAIRAGIPVLASKAVPSIQAIQAARQYGLTLICTAQPTRLSVFSPLDPAE